MTNIETILLKAQQVTKGQSGLIVGQHCMRESRKTKQVAMLLKVGW